ncbi:methionyl-tRNA formyltransferase [Sphingobacterium sp. lm-10]|uniref:methionyl-tRNA formyltransferase n=1 Tax=Sphingobacterium sp. lm-10 TaxID=2944904 RepID=UPI0020206901|nr:methionyl-tRNA formyltransferase [Sphingobacterium sp. lm-10]MCL7986888.1 methionyl-tRNA formyltransferase [Sphingobacterium sp. lm-10]
MRIIFMGTPDFAVASLDALLQAGEKVVAVVTTPDKPAGRGQKMHESAVKQYAVTHHIPVLQPEKLRDPPFLENLKSYQADLQIVVAFRMLPEAVWNMPAHGTVNVHASLLPNYRGAAPINHALINGEKVSGVTTFLLQHEIDTGNVLLQQEVAIKETDNAGDLHDHLMQAGARLLLDTVAALRDGTLKPIPQDDMAGKNWKHAPKIFKEDCVIDWNKPGREVYNLIRGLSPYPTAFTTLQGKVLKIYETALLEEKPNSAPGEYETDHKTYLRFACADSYLDLKLIQIEGKKRMTIADFLRGYRF